MQRLPARTPPGTTEQPNMVQNKDKGFIAISPSRWTVLATQNRDS